MDRKGDDFGLGPDVPFLRTTSNNDLFATLDHSLGISRLTSEQPFDWPKQDSMDSHHSTLASSHYHDEMAKHWSFGFDPNAPIQHHSDSYTSLVPPGDGETIVGTEREDYRDAHYTDPYYPQQNPNHVLDAIQMIGATTFSTSFVEKIMEQSETEKEDQLKYNLTAPLHYPGMEHYYQDPNMWMTPHLGQYWAPGTQASSASLTQSSMHSNSTLQPSSPQKRTKCLPAGDGNNRRKTLQCMIQCSECYCELGIAFIRGSTSVDDDQPVRVVCGQCQDTISPKQLSGSEKKRKRSDRKVVGCEVCHIKIGNGGLDLSDNVKVEYVCRECGDKYMFCSECGGGGKQRTGKWRPKELFEQGRRTCSLPHIRVGNADVHYKAIRIDEITPDMVQGIQDVFFDCLLSLYCVPTIMQSQKYSTFQAVKQEIEQLWLTSVLEVLTNKTLRGEKYVTVAWIHKRHRNKGAGRVNSAKDATPWLQRLNINGIVPPPKVSMLDSEDRNHCFVAFAIAEWDIMKQSIFLAQMAPRSVFLKTMDGYSELIRNCIEQIRKDAFQQGNSWPEHIWCWAKADHARLQSIPGRLKFMAKQDYVHSNCVPSVIFEKPDYEPLNGDGVSVYATSCRTFLTK